MTIYPLNHRPNTMTVLCQTTSNMITRSLSKVNVYSTRLTKYIWQNQFSTENNQNIFMVMSCINFTPCTNGDNSVISNEPSRRFTIGRTETISDSRSLHVQALNVDNLCVNSVEPDSVGSNPCIPDQLDALNSSDYLLDKLHVMIPLVMVPDMFVFLVKLPTLLICHLKIMYK